MTQGSLTGESFPVEKFEIEKNAATTAPIELTSIAFLGTSVESGSATAVVVATGAETYLGGMAESLSEQPTQTAFDKGIAQFTWLMLRFILVMVPLVFVINGLTKGNWTEAFFFAVAVAVGLTPEMLPMIVTVCLSKGALAMSRKKVIVKRINAIQNLGAMDVLCTDKTGTLTMDHVILERHCDVVLKEDDGVLALAYMNSHFQTGLKNVLDRAILAHTETHTHADDPRVRQGGRNPLRLPAPHHVGRGPHARRQGPHHQQGGPGGDLPPLQEFRTRRASCSRWTTSSSRNSRRNTSSSAPMASASWPSPARTSRRVASSRATPRPTPRPTSAT